MNSLLLFQNDLRLQNNDALTSALLHKKPIFFLYIFDDSPSVMEKRGSASQWWLYHSLSKLQENLQEKGQKLILRRGNYLKILEEVVEKYKISSLFWNRTYSPYDRERDKIIQSWAKLQNIHIEIFQGNVLKEPFNHLNQSGKPYLVFTPFYKSYLSESPLAYPISETPQYYPENKIKADSDDLNSWKLIPQNPDWAVQFKHYWEPGEKGAWNKFSFFKETWLSSYLQKDMLSTPSSFLSPHLQWGEVSVRRLFYELEQFKLQVPSLLKAITAYQRSLIWRDFAYNLLYFFPELHAQNQRETFNLFPWENNKELFTIWTKGLTGYPIVDAGMRQLWQTGYLPNRARMIVGSFLVKHLLIDWRWGERWFWDTLIDADLALNSMNWQWVAGTGIDAAPYFRIFNPILQAQKFDPECTYIKEWVPELSLLTPEIIHNPQKLDMNVHYPKPIIDHSIARERSLAIYKKMKKLKLPDSP